jgi:hypothetical protein
MTIEEVHKFYLRAEEVTARALRRVPTSVHHRAVAGHFRRYLAQARQWMHFGTGVSGYKSKDILPILTSCEHRESHDKIIEEVNRLFSRWISYVASTLVAYEHLMG